MVSVSLGTETYGSILCPSSYGAVAVDNLELANFNKTVDFEESGAQTALEAEFKISLNAYLEEVVASLADVIQFNEKCSDLVGKTRLVIINQNH